MDIAALIAAAVKANAAGRLDEAISLCRYVLATDPANVQAGMLLGVIEVRTGRPDAALPILERVRIAEPGSFQARLWLSIAFRQIGRRGEAVEAAEQAVSLNPSDPQGLAQLGLCYIDSRHLPDAEEALRRAVGISPNVSEIRLVLSLCLHLQGRNADAAATLAEALDRKAWSAEDLLATGQSLMGQHYPAGAIECARRALETAPGLAAAHFLRGQALMEHGPAAEAEEPLRMTVSLTPGDAQAVAMLGVALQIRGRFREASAAFRESIRLEPRQGHAFFGYVQNGRVREVDRPTISQMQSLVQNSSLPPNQRSYLQYGLGKSHEDLGEFETAIAHYDEANRIEYEIKYGGRPFDQVAYAASLRGAARQFSKDFFARRRGVGSRSELPVFVVGMMRSGTTLVEQILSSHPAVGAAGEQAFWPDNWRGAMDSTGTEVDEAGIRTLTERYCEILQSLAPGKLRVVDKMPTNRSALGILHLAFPQARIIHIRRHPVDTCLSIYATPNRSKVEFDHNRANIVFAYKHYLSLMDQWRAVLPPDVFLEVEYEALVSDRDRITRQMISWLGLKWSDACLAPESNDRPVITQSVWQVRQPVYQTSVDRWRRFEPWLGEFAELL